jgi:hypothetical protein
MRGTAEWGQPYSITIADQRFCLVEAVAYLPDKSLGSSFLRHEEGIYIQFEPGVLHARESK